MLVAKGNVTSGTIQICVACTATQYHDDIWARVTTEDCVWVHGFTEAKVSVDVRDSYYH